MMAVVFMAGFAIGAVLTLALFAPREHFTQFGCATYWSNGAGAETLDMTRCPPTVARLPR